ncbi:metal-dependent hydrolase [Vitreimonas flagellata]|uniref:metal-dependent hydrolase n=1 Tax=Vitreimonas flagellata TaxID=2560861 RepID=UPI001074A3CD|nr:metal-dependent hydrolase [Vitreimonas flagellata]
MFVGHYAAAFAAKAIEPKAPMWTLAAAAQLVDIGWSAFIIAGIERASVDPSLPGSSLILEHMPWTHSLPMAIAWGIGAALLAKLLLRQPIWASVVIGLTVFSHWLLDLIVHRPDLELWVGGEKVGFGLWNYPVPEQAIEIGLLAITGAAWVASRKTLGRLAWPAIAFIGFLVALQIVAMLSPQPAGPLEAQSGVMILAIYLVVVALAALTELSAKRTT